MVCFQLIYSGEIPDGIAMARYRIYSAVIFTSLAEMSDLVANTPKVRSKRAAAVISDNNAATTIDAANAKVQRTSVPSNPEKVRRTKLQQPGMAPPEPKEPKSSKNAISNLYSTDLYMSNIDFCVRYAIPWKLILEEGLERMFLDYNEQNERIRSAVQLGTVAHALAWEKYLFYFFI